MIHKYYMNGHYIVLDVNSGAVHEVDAAAFAILDDYQDYGIDEICERLAGRFPKEAVTEAHAELCRLEQDGLLFSRDAHAAVAGRLQERAPVVKALCLHIAHDCNLQCKYCFAGEGDYAGEKQLMSAEVGRAAIDFLIAHSGARRNLEVDFFGGEPLLNFAVVKQIVEYGNARAAQTGKVFRFTLTTNGMLLDDEKTRFINDTMTNVVLSLDGRKPIHDRMRQTRGGAGTYDILMPKIKRFVEARGHENYFVRGTFTRENLDFCEDVFHLYNEGFEKISVEPVANAEEEQLNITEDDLARIYTEYERLAVKLSACKRAGEAIEFFHYNIDLDGGPCAVKRVAGCGAGTEYLAVTPAGELYPCHRFVGHEQFAMGDVFTGVTQDGVRARFAESNLYTKEQCKSCFAKFYCGGGCAAGGFLTNGDINEPDAISCALERKRVECALMMKAEGV